MDPIISPALDDYCKAHSTPASALLNELEAHTRTHCQLPQMLTGPLEAAFLQLLVRLTHAKRVLEIGMFTGYSALAMAEALPDDGTIITCDVNEQTSKIAQSFFQRSPHGRKITVKLAPALQTVQTLVAPFDFVFLDADKENYLAYFEACLPLLKPGGLLVADNVLWSGRVLNPNEVTDKAIVEFNARVKTDPRVEAVMVPIRDGVFLIRKR